MPKGWPEKNTPRRLFGNSAGYSAGHVVACVLTKKIQGSENHGTGKNHRAADAGSGTSAGGGLLPGLHQGGGSGKQLRGAKGILHRQDHVQFRVDHGGRLRRQGHHRHLSEKARGLHAHDPPLPPSVARHDRPCPPSRQSARDRNNLSPPGKQEGSSRYKIRSLCRRHGYH